MNDMLERARSGSSLSTIRLIDTSRVGQLLQSFRLDVLNEKLGDRLRALALPSISGHPARRLRRELKDASRDFNPDHEHWTRGPFPRSSLYGWTIPFHHFYQGALSFPSSEFLAVTKIYHPNISSTGEICVSTIKEAWGPYHILRSALMSIGSVLDDPGLDDPLVPEVAETYLRDRSTYDENARLYTQRYGNPDYLFTDDGLERCFQTCLRAIGKE
jgi:ubiquitin-protein ligase